MNYAPSLSFLALALVAGAACAQAPQPPVVTTTTVARTPGYDASVQALAKAADRLRDSIHAMAREPAGPARNQAIREANQALLDTQGAMGQAFDATYAANTPATVTTVQLGAGPATRTITVGPGGSAHCVQLGQMLGCK